MRNLTLIALFLHVSRLCVGCAAALEASDDVAWEEELVFIGGVDVDVAISPTGSHNWGEAGERPARADW